MGFFSSITKGIIGGVAGFFTGGPVGGILGLASGVAEGYAEDRAMRAQKKSLEAQIAAEMNIARAQDPARVVSSITPTATVEQAKEEEKTAANEARRKYSLSRSLYKRQARLGNSGVAGGKTTLG